MRCRHGIAGEDDCEDGGDVLVAWDAGGVETLATRGGRRAATWEVNAEVFPPELVVGGQEPKVL